MNSKSLNGAQWLARALSDNNITHVFFIDAVLRNTLVQLDLPDHKKVKRVLAHSEKSAAYMADGYARASGRPGFCFAQSVGAANLAAGLQDAWLGQSPVIALTGRKQSTFQHRNAYQEVMHKPLFSAVTKLTAAVEHAEDLPRLFLQACRKATNGRPGPVHLDLNGIYGDIVELGEVNQAVPSIEELKENQPIHRTISQRSRLTEAAQQLKSHKKVVIIAGRGAAISQAGAEIIALAERLHAPIATELGALDIIPYAHPNFIGVAGRYAAPPTNEIIYSADLVFFIGSDTGELVTDSWQVPALEKKVLQIDINPIEFGRSYSETYGLAGDPKLTVSELLKLVDESVSDSTYLNWAREITRKWHEKLSLDEKSQANPIHVSRLLDAINETLPENAVVVADTGFSAIWTATHLKLNGVNQKFFHAAGSLGWAFPAAIGAKCALPESPVICFTGDGGFYYHMSELETAKRLGVPLVVVVNNNSGFGQSWTNISRTQGSFPGDPSELAKFGPTNFANIAESFAIRSRRVENPSELEDALKEALNSDELFLLDIVTDFNARAPQPWLPSRK
ncbi:thiamine pyrophosphate-binding protein [Paenalcaligenes sp. Me131]|uniref:thiamine pyrophosphate-binding protein n=1 Tax=Paenalcaligenes sp. Me131 TaxID=3392636 RepID=UPI003D2B7E5B